MEREAEEFLVLVSVDFLVLVRVYILVEVNGQFLVECLDFLRGERKNVDQF